MMATTTTNDRPTSAASMRKSMDKSDVAHIETTSAAMLEAEYLARFPALAGKTEEELAKLNKSVLRKLDWKFLPCITLMLLMK